MKKRAYFAGIDNDGSAIKAVVFDESDRELSVSQIQIPMNHPNPGWTKRGPLSVWRGNCQIIRDAIGKAQIYSQDIKGVSVCEYSGGLELLDNANTLIAPSVVSTDTRASQLLGEYSESDIDDSLYQMTLQNLWVGQQTMLPPWLKKHRPDLLKQACHMVSVKGYIRYYLTGMLVINYTSASCINLLNIHDRQFNPEIFGPLDTHEYFHLVCVPILRSSEAAGFVTSEAAIQCDLTEGIPVTAGLYDVDSYCLANGILDSSCLCLITGTWSISEYLTNDLEECVEENDNTITFLPDHYMTEESGPTSASNSDWYANYFLGQVYPGLERRELYGYCSKAILESGLKQTDILFMPYLYASNSVPDTKGAFFNLGSSHTPTGILLTVYEGILFSSCCHIEELTGTVYPQKWIRLSGGITNSPVWAQVLADILQPSIQVMEEKKRRASGAAVCTSVACDCYSSFHGAVKEMCHLFRTYIPDSSKAALCKEKCRRFKKAIQVLEFFYKQESKRAAVLKTECLQAIVDIVNKERIVTSEELMHQLNISKTTARRDIEELSSQGLIQKTRGGAVSANHASLEPSLVKEKGSNAGEKAHVAKAARKHICPDEKIILNSGTTALGLAKLVNDIPDLTVVTNDLHIVSEVSTFPNVTLLMVGGVVRKGFNSTYGYFVEKMLRSISVSKTFLSIDTADVEHGLLSYITDDTNIKKQCIKSGKEVILLCDYAKFRASAFININQLDCISRIIMGRELNAEYVDRLGSLGTGMELIQRRN